MIQTVWPLLITLAHMPKLNPVSNSFMVVTDDTSMYKVNFRLIETNNIVKDADLIDVDCCNTKALQPFYAEYW